MAHPSLLNKCGVNLALLLSSFLQLSLEAFSSITGALRALATVPRPGMRSFWFAFFPPLVSVFGVIFKEFLFFSLFFLCVWSGYTVSVSFSFLCVLFSLLFRYPSKIERALVVALRESALIPSLREEWNRPGWGGAGAFIPHPYPPSLGGQKATPSPAFTPSPTYPISLPAVCSHYMWERTVEFQRHHGVDGN